LLLFLFLALSLPGLAATYTVTNCADAGPGSLPYEIASLESTDTLAFNIPTTEAPSTGEAYSGIVTEGSDVWCRIVVTQLDWLNSNNINVSGSTQTSNQGDTNSQGPEIEIRVDSDEEVLRIRGYYVTVEGLVVNRTSGSPANCGIYFDTADYGHLYGCYIGTTATGEAASSGQHNYGVYLNSSADSNTIGGIGAGQGNLISGNSISGIYITGGSDNNDIQKNIIGLDKNAQSTIPNGAQGILISNGTGNTIGGTSVSARNFISGNGLHGIEFDGAGAVSNEVLGNYIGTDVNGTADLGNASSGVRMENGAKGNKVGDGTAAGRNIISGNATGVEIKDTNTNSNEVIGNYIGTDVSGTSALGNSAFGVYVNNGAQYNYVGGLTGTPGTGKGNVISGNDNAGVVLYNAATSNNSVYGNLIGTASNGASALPNGGGVAGDAGVFISDASQNYIGAGTTEARNIISGNNPDGVRLYGSSTTNNQVQGNYIGTDITGTSAISNESNGIYILSSANNNTIGGDSTWEGNVISGQDGGTGHHGVYLYGSGVANNRLRNNIIGLNAGQTSAIPNNIGVYLLGTGSNEVGGSGVRGNVISGNTTFGLQLQNCESGSIVRQNYVGTNYPALDAGLGNGGAGIALVGCSLVVVGGVGSTEANAIVGNNYGISISSDSGNIISGNYIGVVPPLFGSPSGMGNTGYGIYLSNTTGNIIGGATFEAWNTIGSNEGAAAIYMVNASSNEISGNMIGIYYDLNSASDFAFPNVEGIRLSGTSNGNMIGSTEPSARNIISNNSSYGIYVNSDTATKNEIFGNYIGVSTSGEAAAPNQSGVLISGNPASYNTIGGPTAAYRNVISGNTQYGVNLGSGASNCLVANNYIGTNAGGNTALANQHGIYINNGHYNTIEANVVSGNSLSGIYLNNISVTNNQILGNIIGLDAGGNFAIANTTGISIDESSYNKIGNKQASGRNIISGNSDRGIYISQASSNEVYGNYIGLTASGEASVGNATAGIGINSSVAPPAIHNKIGDGTAGGRNIISGNGDGIKISQSLAQYNEVFGNYIGTDKDGESGLGNTGDGIEITGKFNYIGNASGGGNVISDNNIGIYINQSGASSNEVLGNYIGTDKTGAVAMGNSSYGIYLAHGAKYNYIGNGDASGRNIISNNSYGFYISSATSSYPNNNRIQGNYIGTDVTGTLDFGNGQDGILFEKGSFNTVGPNNLIAFNGADGIEVKSSLSTHEVITRNSIHSNDNNGIVLTSGGNQGISAPTILTADHNEATNLTLVTGSASAQPNGTIEVFKAEGNQGKTYLGSTIADGSGNWSVNVTGLVSGDGVVATGTTANPETSAFSASVEAVTTVFAQYQPDNMVATLESGSDYIGQGIFNADGAGQTRERAIAAGSSATYYVKVRNAGNATDEVNLTAAGSSSGWSVTFYDAKSGGSDITSLVFGAGWSITDFASGETAELRVVVAPGATTQGTLEVLVTSTSTTTPKDAVLARTVATTTTTTTTTFPGRTFTESDLGVTGMSMNFPAGSVSAEPTVTVEVTSTPPGALPSGFSVGGTMVDIDCTPATLLSPVTVTIPVNGPLADPRVRYWDGTAWSSDGITLVSVTETSITFTTTHFTLFAPLAALPSNLVRFGPNPFDPNSATPARIWYWLSADAETSIYVVDMRGTLVWKNTYASGSNGGRADANSIAFDGRDQWGNVLANGVYIYKIVQGGQSVGGGRIAVIKQ